MRAWALGLGLCLAAAASAAPEVLIIQLRAPRDAKEADNVAILSYIAQELDDEGRVVPIAWSLTDPVFRAAVDDGHIKRPPTYPSMELAFEIANKLRITYVLAVQVWKKDGSVLAKGALYKGGKILWKDPDLSAADMENRRKALETEAKNAAKAGAQAPQVDPDLMESRLIEVTVGNAGFDLDGASRSLARTWTHLLGSGPFASHPAHPKAAPPVPVDEGTKPAVVAPPPPPPKADNRKLSEDSMRLMAAGQTDAAIAMLRDAVDSEPLDAERRRLLIQSLLAAQRPRQAAEQGRRAAELLPTQIEFRTLAAQAWLQAGDLDEANADLNEAVARDPEAVATRSLLGDVSLHRLKPEDAITHYEVVIGKAPSTDALCRRALAYALLGQKDKVAADLVLVAKSGWGSAAGASFIFTSTIIDRSVLPLGDDARTLLQRARVKPDAPEVATDIAEMLQQAEALAAVVEAVPIPQKHQPSAEQRKLALKLLAQFLAELSAYVRTRDEDALTDATIDLGEAIKNAKAAQERFATESASS